MSGYIRNEVLHEALSRRQLLKAGAGFATFVGASRILGRDVPVAEALDANCQQATNIVGRVVLFISVECQNWSPADFGQAARFARSLGIDTIAPKRADGSIRWYQNVTRFKQERAAVLAAGCGYLPWAYCYGPALVSQYPTQIEDECAVLAEMMAANNGSVGADLEKEWDGQVAAAQKFSNLMLPVPGFLYLTTFANPYEQNWSNVVRALAPCVNAWVPQQYTNYLAGQEGQFTSLGQTCLQPALYLASDYSGTPNNAVANAQQAKAKGHGTVWLWYYRFAQDQQQLVKNIVSVMKS